MPDNGSVIQSVIDIEANTKNAVSEINRLGSSLGDVAKQVDDIIARLDALSKKAVSVSRTTNFNIPQSRHAVSGQHGAMTSETGREKNFRDYQRSVTAAQDALNRETHARTGLARALEKDAKARSVLRQQNANSAQDTASARLLSAQKAEDRTTAGYLRARKARTDALNESKNFRAYRERHPELFATGGRYASWRLQGAGALSSVGDRLSTSGLGGRIAGDALAITGSFLMAPAVGAMTALTIASNAVIDFGRAVTKSYAEIESARTQLGVVSSSQSQAESLFGDISRYAVKSPFGIQETTELAVLLKQSGVYATDIMDTMRMLGDTAGGNIEKMKRIANNYAQIVSIGKASMLDMRQFAYAGIPIFEAVSKELGVSQQELRTLISDGKVTSDIIEKVFRDLTGINGIFENATEAGAKTLKARLQNLSDAKQLAAASWGERILNIGTRTGGDSYALKIIDTAEKIYEWLKESAGTKNIENSVKTIENRNGRIEELELRLRAAESIRDIAGNSAYIEALHRAIAGEIAKGDIDKERQIYANSYDTKYNDLEKYQREVDAYGFFMPAYGSYANLLDRIAKEQYSRKGAGGYNSEFAGLDDDMLALVRESVEQLVKALEGIENITSRELQAKAERDMLNAQSLSADQTNKSAGTAGSLNTRFQELAEIYRNSEEQQKKAEEKRTALLREALGELKNLSRYADKNGTVNLNDLSRDEFLSYREKGAFTVGRSLTAVEGKNAAQLAADRPVLESQYRWAAKQAYQSLSGASRTAFEEALRTNDALLGKDDTEFIRNFPKVLSELKKTVDGLIRTDTKNEKLYRDILTSFDAATNVYELNTAGLNADLDQMQKKKNDTGDMFIPLWKRILAENTGLTTQGMVSTEKTLANYTDNMAVRSITSGVLKAAMGEMGVGKAMSLVKATDKDGGVAAARLRGDTGYTIQVNWERTGEAVREFATNLSTATEAVSAYRSGLEGEIGVLQNLLAAGYTQGESQDLKNQKFVSLKELGKYDADGDQLVNAFGEYLATEDGLRVAVENGRFLDEKGNEIAQDQLVIMGNLYDIIKKKLPDLTSRLTEAISAESNRNQIDELKKEVMGTSLSSALLSYGGASRLSAYAVSNPGYLEKLFDANLRSMKVGSELEGMTNEGIWLSAQSGNKKAAELIKTVFKAVLESAQALVESPAYQELAKSKEGLARANALNNLISRTGELNGWEIRDDGPAWYPDDGRRTHRNRFVQGWLGTELAYDQEDLYLAAARLGNGADRNRNALGIDSGKFEGMNDEEILGSISSGEKATVRWKAQLLEVRDAFADLEVSMAGTVAQFAGESLTSTFETWGRTLAEGADSAKALGENFRQLASGLASNLGQMMTQAGLAMIIGSMGTGPKLYAGLALVAAGMGLSFLGGMLGADADGGNKDSDDGYQRLLKIKDDLTELLKQAREDSIYYENTVRHKNAISANDALTQKKVNDAVITPSGEIISTHPDDYLIATKTPRSLLGGGAPTINFSVVDKSTGIKVTQQRSAYNEDGSIDFEAVIESKVNEIISSPKGDEAFFAREARLRGRSVIA